jgi:diketogulonate reductase-like aldo/keto reductase
MEEIVRAFNYLLDNGLIFYWGTSEWSATELQQAWLVADKLGMQGPVIEQVSLQCSVTWPWLGMVINQSDSPASIQHVPPTKGRR